MRRRECLRTAAGAAGLAGLTAGALPSVATRSHRDTSPRSQGFEPLGHVEITNEFEGFQATEAVTTPDGDYAFVSKLDGFHVVDVREPAAPEIVATRDAIQADQGGSLNGINDLKYNRDRLLVAADVGSPFDGFALFDVSDRTDPRLLTSYRTGYPIHNCYLSGGHAYLTTGRALEIVDVTAVEPSSVATWSVVDYDDAYTGVSRNLRDLHDVYVQGDRAYLAYWDAGSWILDVSDPTDPTHLGHVREYTPEELRSLGREAFFEPPGNDHYVQPNDDGTIMAVGKESWDVEGGGIEGSEPEEEDRGGPSGIELWDVSDPADPTALATIDPPRPPEGETARRDGGYYTTAHNFDVVGDYLYSSWYRAGVKVHDISDPREPRELAHWENGAETSFWTAKVAVAGEFFVGSSHGAIPDADVPGGLYTFPDPTDNDATVTPSGPDVPVPGGSGTPSRSPTATPTPTATRDPTPTRRPTASSTRTGTEPATSTGTGTGPGAGTSGEGGPGFGSLAALAGLGVGAWRLVERAGREGGGD